MKSHVEASSDSARRTAPRRLNRTFWPRVRSLASVSLPLIAVLPMLTGCFDPAKDTCDATDVVSRMRKLASGSLTMIGIFGIEVGMNGYKRADGQTVISYRETFDSVVTRGWDNVSRIASCTGIFHFHVAPHGNTNAPETEWSNTDLNVKYRVQVTDDNHFIISNNDWDWQ
jgi:hypothetical protein